MLRALLVLLCLFGNDCTAQVIDASGVEVQWGGRVPMRDGRTLAVTVYRPRGAAPLPVIYVATPYIADLFHDRAMYFARRQYVVALVDGRGRGNSDGEFEPFLHDASDGYDTVEWLAAQPWSNGKVAMWGGSYSGFSQWATAKTRPPHLKTIVPAASAHPGVDFPYLQNRMSTYPARWLTFTAGRTLNGNLFASDAVFEGVGRQVHEQHLPFASLDRLLGNPSGTFQLWLQHPEVDEFWDALTPSNAEYASIDLPVLTITGYYDGDQLGALAYYRKHLAAIGPEARERHYFIVGPWDHAGTRAPRRELGGLSFGPNSLLDLDRMHWQWYDWTLKGGPKPEFLKARVAYYLPGNGKDEWRYADSLDQVSTVTRTLHLSSVDGRANDVFAAGDLSETVPRGASKPDRWVYDPLDTRAGIAPSVEQSLSGYLSQADAMNLGGAGVVYHSAPFLQSAQIAGQPKLRLYLSMDVPDADLEANLYEIQSDGKSIQLSGATLRARYRQSLRQATPVPAGKVLPYDFDQFSYFARELAVGSRLRLVVRSPNSIHVQKNYNSGGVVAHETARDARTAHIQLHHDARYPSQLTLPLVDAAAEDVRLVTFLDDAGRQQYLKDASAVVAEVLAKAPAMFARMPKSGLEVRAIEPWRQATAGVAFYNPGSPDGSRPGVVYVNLSDLTQTLKPQLEGIACHEGAPGHHFQFDYARHAQGLPKLRRFGGYGVYSEGWALYAEGLCKELGLYRDPYSDLGRLSQDAWRAARLVADTGLHAKRWSRAQAIAYFKENTLLSDLDVTREVDRYIAHPGQATSYKIGQLKIYELRHKAEAALGAKFDLRAFHEAVLEGGSLPLDVLEEQVDDYIDRAVPAGGS